MDWNLKIPSWDFTDFEQGTIPNIDSTSGSSSYGGQGIKGNFCVDLKLGQVIDSGNELKSTSKMALSPSASSKRARPINNTIPAATCLVDGCNADLSNCKEYHRRHKVCEVHSKTAQVSINGQKQRFCQQCSRFHSLEEFDEGKRSCRKRLDGHNRRRRKPQPDTSRASSLFSGHQGATMLQFSSPHLYQTTSLTNHLWTTVKSEEQTYSTRHSTMAHKQNPFPESSSGGKKLAGKQQFSLFHGSHLKLNHQTSPPKVCQQSQSQTHPQPQPQTVVTFEGNSSGSYEKLFCDGYPPPAAARVVQPVVQSSDCALSLLSSSPSQTSSTTLSHVMHPSNSYGAPPNPMDPGTGAGYGGLESIMDPNGNGNDCDGMIQMGIHHQHHHHHHHHHASPDNGAPQTLPFYWE